MSNTTHAPFPSDDDTAYRLVASVQITEIGEDEVDTLVTGLLGALPSIINDPMALQDYPNIPSQPDNDDYRYYGG